MPHAVKPPKRRAKKRIRGPAQNKRARSSHPAGKGTIFTVGHSTRTLPDFIHLLKAHGIKRLVDIRSIPRSRHTPQFNRDVLAARLRSAGLNYVYLKRLGGRLGASGESRRKETHSYHVRGGGSVALPSVAHRRCAPDPRLQGAGHFQPICSKTAPAHGVRACARFVPYVPAGSRKIRGQTVRACPRCGPSVRRSVESLESAEFLFPIQMRRLQEPDTAVPAKNGVIVSRRAQLFGFSKAPQRLLEEREQGVRSPPGAKLRLGSPLAEKPAVIPAFVRVFEPAKYLFCFRVAIGRAAEKLVGDREAEQPQGHLLFRFNGQNIAANGLRFFRLVQVAVELGLREGLRDALLRDGFELVVHRRAS